MRDDRPPVASKRCAHCGRVFAWRKRWASCWERVLYCSAACREGRSRAGDKIDRAVLELLATRGRGKSICPSEVARALGGAAWRERMEDVRDAAVRLVRRGAVVVTQGDAVVDPAEASGPIRIRLA